MVVIILKSLPTITISVHFSSLEANVLHSYRITKYTQYNSDGYLASPPDEWTSFHEIDSAEKELNYLEVEEKYLNAIIKISNCMNIDHYMITDLERSFGSGFHNHQRIEISDIETVARAILREQIWCKLKSTNGEFHFGYDYYMYFTTTKSPPDCMLEPARYLTVEKFPSPYLHPTD